MLHEYKAYLENFMMDFDFPKEAQAELNGFYQKVFSRFIDSSLYQEFCKTVPYSNRCQECI